MSGFFNRIAKYVTLGSKKRLIGKDLDGNKYFELPAVNGGRVKRVVEYRVARDVADYTSGTNRLPVQWTTWLSHTRSNPPTIEELQTDFARQSRLRPMIAAIEDREREERIRQGYLSSPASAQSPLGQISGPSENRHSSLGFNQPQNPVAGPSRSTPSPQQRTSSSVDRRQEAVAEQRSDPNSPDKPYTVPSAQSDGVAPPPPTVDPSKHSSAEELRRLSQEDTRRRMEQSKQEDPVEKMRSVRDGGAKVEVPGATFKPKRRGR